MAARRGVDISAHRSRVLAVDQLEVDLVLCMERAHVREAVVLDATAFGRVFTLPELVRLARDFGPRHPRQALGAWLKALGASRRPIDFASVVGGDEVDDPYGRGLATYEWCADELSTLIDELVQLAWPRVDEQEAPADAARAG